MLRRLYLFRPAQKPIEDFKITIGISPDIVFVFGKLGIVEVYSANSIPDSCTVTVDIRALTPEAIRAVQETVERIAATSYIGGTSCHAELLSIRPPMVRAPQTQALFDKLLAVCHKYELGTLTPMEAGGGSDSCYTQMARAFPLFAAWAQAVAVSIRPKNT